MDECCSENKVLSQRVSALESEVKDNMRKSVHKLREKVQINQVEIANQKQWRKDFQKEFNEFKTDIKVEIKSMSNTQMKILIGIGILSGLLQYIIQ